MAKKEMNFVSWTVLVLLALVVLLIMRVSKLNDTLSDLETYVEDCVTQDQFEMWKKTQKLVRKGGTAALRRETGKKPEP